MPLVADWGPPGWRDEVVDDLEETPPRFFIVGRDDALPEILYTPLDSEHSLATFPRLATWVAEGYFPVYDLEAFVVYQRFEPS